MHQRLKDVIRQSLARFGYVIRSAGPNTKVTGADLLHDVGVVLHDIPSPLLFDVGANVGQTIGDFLYAFRAPRIWAFEPSPASFTALSGAYQSRPGVVLERLAMGAQEGVLPFHITADDSTNDSLLSPQWNAGGTVIDVPVTTVDVYCASHAIDRIDLLKIDAQGFDLEVLRGAARMLAAHKIRAIVVEVMCSPMYMGQPSLTDLISFAEAGGYRVLGFYDQTYNRDALWYFNVCFRSGRSQPLT